MKKVADFIVEKRYFVIISFLVLTGLCMFFMKDVTINEDIIQYLPKNNETRIGNDIMTKEFGELPTSNLLVMFPNLEDEEEMLETLKNIKYVESVDFNDSSDYHKDGYTLYQLNVNYPASSEEAKAVYDRVNTEFKEDSISLSGTIYEENQPVLQGWIIALSIGSAMVILIFMCDSYVEPFLFLFTIGLAVFINKGTNIMFDSVSNITDSICAVLQMALSMDYSIMLMNRYTQEIAKKKDQKEAMKAALLNSFGSISSSSVTTIVGLLALVFMSFTIGKDLGFVLAKGVLFSLVSIFVVLPGLILLFDPWIQKTQKKHLKFDMCLFGRASYALRYPALILIIFVFVGAFLLKGNLQILYTSQENDKIASVFDENNQMAIIYDNNQEENIATFCRNLENQNISQVLCYGNTLNQKLSYQELKPKMSELGKDVEIDDYLLKIIYYNYYHGDRTGLVRLDDLISFIETDVYSNEKFEKEIDADMRNNIARLKHFANKEEMEALRSSSELSEILGLSESEIQQLLLLYHSKNVSSNLTIEEFVRFVDSDVLTNPEFSKYVDSNTRSRLSILRQFIDVNLLYQNMDSNSMSSVFGMDASKMSDLYVYYASIHGVDTKLTMHEFSRFLLEEVSTNPEYASLFDESTLNSIQQLYQFSDSSFVNRVMTSKELADVCGISEEKVIAVLTLKKMEELASTNTTVDEFLTTFKEYLEKGAFDGIDITKLKELMEAYQRVKDNTNVSMDKESIQVVFSNIDSTIIDSIFETVGKDSITTSEFLDQAILSLKGKVDENTYQTLVVLKDMLNAKVNGTLYNTGELAILLQVDEETIQKIQKVQNTFQQSYSTTPKEFITYVSLHMDDVIFEKYLDEETKTLITKANLIISNISNEYDATTISQMIGMDEATTKSLYALYSRNNLRMNRYDIIHFLLDYKEDSRIGLDSNTISQLQTLSNVVDGVLNHTFYNSSDMGNLLGTDLESVRLVYSYYEMKHQGGVEVSLYDLVNFILNDVLNSRFSDKVSSSNVVHLNQVHKIMDNSLNGVGYSSVSLYNQLLPLTDSLNFKLIDIAYIYYGSIYKYNQNDRLTIEEFVTYLNQVILKDNRFTDYIDSEQKQMIVDSKKTVFDAKKLLVGKNYSRALINTTYDAEGKETFEFIEDLKDELKGKNGVYLIGNSPMAYELNKTFANEFNFISILTMIFIFIVVAITFHSFFIPLILTLIIQCAVYVTMCILSVFGGTLYFISLLIVQSILMGATIDYAILFTSYYLELRQKYNKKGALIYAYNNSIHTILTSSSVLIIVTFIVGFFADAIAAKICMTISQGTLCATLLVLFILPAVLAALDRFLVKKN